MQRIGLLILSVVVCLSHAGCGKSTGGLELSDLSRQVSMLREELEPGSPACVRGDTTYLYGFVESHIEHDGSEYTILALGEPEYDSGSPGSTWHDATGTHYSPPVNASVSIEKGKVLYSVPGYYPKNKGFWSSALYVMSARLTETTLNYRDQDITLVIPTAPPAATAEPEEKEASNPFRRAPRTLALPGTRDYISERDRFFKQYEEDPNTSSSFTSIMPPSLPAHLADLDGRVLLVCEKKYDLGFFGAPVPPNLRLRFDPMPTSKVYGQIQRDIEKHDCAIDIEDAVRIYLWARAYADLDKATEFIFAESTPFFISVDRRGVIQLQRDRRAVSYLRRAVSRDTLWCLSHALLASAYHEIGETEKAEETIEMAIQRSYNGSPIFPAFEQSDVESSSAFVNPFRVRTAFIRDDAITRRKWNIGASWGLSSAYKHDSPEEIGNEGIRFELGANASYRIWRDFLFEMAWKPYIWTGFTEPLMGKFDSWQMDRFSLTGRYQIPVRVQFWSSGSRVHLSGGVDRIHESFTIEYFSEGQTLNADAKSWAVHLAVGLSSRRSFSSQSRRHVYWEIGYRFGLPQEYHCTLGGKDAEVTSAANAKPISLDPSGWFVSLAFLY